MHQSRSDFIFVNIFIKSTSQLLHFSELRFIFKGQNFGTNGSRVTTAQICKLDPKLWILWENKNWNQCDFLILFSTTEWEDSAWLALYAPIAFQFCLWIRILIKSSPQLLHYFNCLSFGGTEFWDQRFQGNNGANLKLSTVTQKNMILNSIEEFRPEIRFSLQWIYLCANSSNFGQSCDWTDDFPSR